MLVEPQSLRLEGSTFGGYFTVVKRLGGGSFGEIYEGFDQRNQQKVALKFESTNANIPQLRHESKVYQKLDGIPSFPKLLWFGTQSGFNILVIELLGVNLETFRSEAGGKISLKNVLNLGDQMIGIIQRLHKLGFIHRDIKPENFLFAQGTARDTLYLIDFGLSCSFIDPMTKQHIRFSDNHQLVGTARYASVNTLFGYMQSRRDDLESIFYVMIYLFIGHLPWQGLHAASEKDKCDKIRDLKLIFTNSEEFLKLPKELRQVYDNIKKLSFNEDPDYNKLRVLIRELSIKKGYTSQQDWEPLMIRNRIIRTTPVSSKPKKLFAKACNYGSFLSHDVVAVPFVPKNVLSPIRKSSHHSLDVKPVMKKKRLNDSQDFIVC